MTGFPKRFPIQCYRYHGDWYFIIDDPRNPHSSLFYMRIEWKRKWGEFVFGKGCQGGLVVTFQWGRW